MLCCCRGRDWKGTTGRGLWRGARRTATTGAVSATRTLPVFTAFALPVSAAFALPVFTARARFPGRRLASWTRRRLGPGRLASTAGLRIVSMLTWSAPGETGVRREEEWVK
jgi:hypothetical protein